MKYLGKILICLLLLPVISVALAVTEQPTWGTVQGQKAILYLPAADTNADFTGQVGTTLVEMSVPTPLSELEVPIETVIVIDNSQSIIKEDRDVVEEILRELVSAGMTGEKFTIATISDEVTYLCQHETEREALLAVIAELQYHDQYTQLTDGLYQIFMDLMQQQDGLLRRVVVIADGVDNKQIGYTRNELDALIAQSMYPVYSIGCKNLTATAEVQIESLFALSRVTSGQSYYLANDITSTDIVAGITEWNDAVQVELTLPKELCDGSNKMIQVTDGEKIYKLQLAMPFETVVTEPEPEPVMISGEEKEIPWVLIAIVAVVIVAGSVSAILLKRQREEKMFETLSSDEIVNTRRATSAPTVFFDESSDMDITVSALDDELNKRIIFQDVSESSRCYEVILDKVISVGRDSVKNQLVLDYDPTVGRHQCDIYERNGRVWVRNQSKTNITQVNGKECISESELTSGCTLKMGRVVMRVEIV